MNKLPRNLGLYLGEKLTFNYHIKENISKTKKGLRYQESYLMEVFIDNKGSPYWQLTSLL